ncbi:hypothetical protein [Streptomyces sp. Tue6028]|uniref:hypothetical protein n=1 Tax=Streptomyces sp. Tue6028 TaxID=2036037 RepID=UPI003D7540CE
MTDSRSALTETLAELDILLERLGRSRATELDIDDLAREACLSPDVVVALLDGGEPPAEDFTARVVSRIKMLRETRLRPDGKPYSWQEIADSFGVSRASLSGLVSGHGKSGPLASTQAGIETFFFSEPTGFLSAEPASALNAALSQVVERLSREEALEHLGVQEVALRSAAGLSAGDWELVNMLIARLAQEARQRNTP